MNLIEPSGIGIAEELNQLFARMAPEDQLGWIDKEYRDSVTFACSFGAEDVVLVDMIAKFAPSMRIFMLDTGRLHEETYDVFERCRSRYGIEIEVYSPLASEVQELVQIKGPFSFRESIENRKECCGIRKVEPLNRALKGKSGWVTGLRREQSITRTKLNIVEIDPSHHGILKFNPLADFTEQMIWDYIHQNQVPYNRLHDQGFPSIGCNPCTRAIAAGEDVRAGRWWWENPEHKECGLHSRNLILSTTTDN